jgi:hypothetical protein
MNAFIAGLLLAVGLVSSPAAGQEAVPDFKLNDTNLKSNRRSLQVSPRDYILQVSGFYFGSAG